MPSVSNLSFVPASGDLAKSGLLGWLAFDLDGTWRVDGVALRRTRRGDLALSFPSRIDRHGFAHWFVRPTCDRARREIEGAILAELGLEATLLAAHQEPHELARAVASDANGHAASEQSAEEAGAELGGGERHGNQRTAKGRNQ
jgi:hypothetical protein